MMTRILDLEAQVSALTERMHKTIEDYYIEVSGSTNPATINLIYELEDIDTTGLDRVWKAENDYRIVHTETNGWEIQDNLSATLLSCNGGTKPATSEDNPYDETWSDLSTSAVVLIESPEIII